VTRRLGVVVTAGPDNGGTYQYSLAMVQSLQHVSGFDITLYGDPQNPDFTRFGYPIIPYREPYARQFLALAADRLHVQLGDPFAAQDAMLAPIYSLTMLHTSRPFVYTLHDLQQFYYPENFSRFQLAWRQQIYTRVSARARRIICESEYVKSDIMRFYGIDAERIAVIPAPPQREFLRPADDHELRAARSRLGLPERFLFYPAHFWHHKNHLRLIEAFREAVREEPDLKLVLTGNQQEAYPSVMAAIDDFGLKRQILCLGYVTQQDLQAIYQLAIALVMPSLFESVSIPVYEAFQLGTPVAASNILALPEQIGETGLLFDPKSPASIRQAILDIARNPEAARRRAILARERMATMTPHRYGARLQELLDQVK
jgi:glycosyltransferase involved in cell wall biosynthesis